MTRPSLLDLVKDLSRNIHSLKHTRETRYPVRPGEASYMQRLLHGVMRLNRRETHLATQNVGMYRAYYSKELPGSERVASRDGKHAKEGTLKPQVPRLSAVASWRLLRRRGSGRPVGSRRREGRPQASTRCKPDGSALGIIVRDAPVGGVAQKLR